MLRRLLLTVVRGVRELQEQSPLDPARTRRPGGGRKRKAEYSLQANRKPMEGTSHPDRDRQFEYINAEVRRRMARGTVAAEG